MYKKILFLLLTILLSQNASSKSTSKNESNGIQAGHLLSSIMINLNSLTQVQFCQYKNILNSNVSLAEKDSLITQNPIIYSIHQNIGVNMENLRLLDLNSNINDSVFMNGLITTFYNDLGYTDVGIINGGNPCNAYKWLMRECALAFSTCMGGATLNCLSTGPIYWACLGSYSLVCAGVAYVCVESADASYPNCVPNGIIHLNNWISNSSTSCN